MYLPRGKFLCEKLFFWLKKIDFENKIGPKIDFLGLKSVQIKIGHRNFGRGHFSKKGFSKNERPLKRVFFNLGSERGTYPS
jgi:hypothetical protein